jgi:tetratricopeptide (TPR) repeat protein
MYRWKARSSARDGRLSSQEVRMKRLLLLLVLLMLAPGVLAGQQPSKVANDHVVRGNKLADEGKYDDARQEYEAAIKVAPKWFEPHYELAYLHWRLKDSPAALRWIDSAIALQPDCFLCYDLKGSIVSNAGDPRASLAEFQKAIDLKPGYGRSYFNIAVAYLRLQETDTAIEWLKKAEVAQPAYASPYYQLGKIYFQQERLFLAAEQWIEFKKLEPKGPRFEEVSKLVDADLTMDSSLKDDDSALHLAYCMSLAASTLPEEYRKRRPDAETYIGDLADELAVVGSFIAILEETSKREIRAFDYLVKVRKAGFLEEYLLDAYPARFGSDRQIFEQSKPERLVAFRSWAARNHIRAEPIKARCSFTWMGRTWHPPL